MAAQTVGDLRTLVVRRAGIGRRVALLSADEALVKGLQANRCEVLADPGLEELEAFKPQLIVAFDAFVADGLEAFRLVARAAPEAELLISFANAASSSALLAALSGQGVRPGLVEDEVQSWLRSVGYLVAARDIVVSPHQASGLAADTEASLRALFEQLNPSAAVDRVLWLARRGVEATSADRVAGLISVVVSGGGEVAALEGTLASVAGQQARPLEVVVVASHPDEVQQRVLERVKGRAGIEVRWVQTSSVDPAARLNQGLACSRGQYVTFLEAGELLGPRHLHRLLETLAKGTQAWALAPGASLHGPFRLAAWLELGAVHAARWLVDRDRLGRFALTFPEGVAEFEGVLFTRISLVFSPSLLDGGDELDTSRQLRGAPQTVQEHLKGRPLRGLISLDEVLAAPNLQAWAMDRLEAARPGLGSAVAQALTRVRRLTR